MERGDGAGPRERPIIFTGANVRAILDGRKTQTRRVIKPPAEVDPDHWMPRRPGRAGIRGDRVEVVHWPADHHEVCWGRLPCAVGARLWVREAWKPHSTFAGVPPRDIPQSEIFYAADNAYAPSNTPWRSPIHMPRWASRLTLAVTDVRVERLQDISREDAIAEGLIPLGMDLGFEVFGFEGDSRRGTPISAYTALWNSIHGRDAWDQNPWVAAISFEILDVAAGERATAGRAGGGHG